VGAIGAIICGARASGNPLQVQRRKKVVILLGLGFLLAVLSPLVGRWTGFPDIATRIKTMLIAELTIGEPNPLRESHGGTEKPPMLYVLGAAQGSLRHHLELAADLYMRGLARTLYILDRPGITEYSPALNRNLTNNEWAVAKLEKLGVSRKDMRFASVHEGFGGTYREAEEVVHLALRDGNRKLILVTSPYHTRRTHLAFSHFAGKRGLEIYVYGSNDNTGLRGLMLEYAKYLSYRVFLTID
jgi:hypothetical protein